MFVCLRVFSHDMSKPLDNKTSSFYLYSALNKRDTTDVNIVINGEIRTNNVNCAYSKVNGLIRSFDLNPARSFRKHNIDSGCRNAHFYTFGFWSWQMLQREPGDTMHKPNFRLSKQGNKQSFWGICCFRCHLFLCVYLACCHVEQQRAAKPSGSSGSRGTCGEAVMFSCHSALWGTARGSGGTAERHNPVTTCPERRPYLGPEPRS